MTYTQTHLSGCYSIEPTLFSDARGYFMETFNERDFAQKTGQEVHFVQDNQSSSSKGVVRGLHYQTGNHAQAKLVRVLQGEVLDIALDIRPGSPTFGQHFSLVLSEENGRQLFIPRGFAHGFAVLSQTAIFFYKCDNFYNKESEGGISYNDPELGIDWKLSADEMILSDKDLVLPTLKNAKKAW